MQKKEIENLVKESTSRTNICEKLGIHANESNIKYINSLIIKYNLDISHFQSYGRFVRKYEKIEKTCPVCGKVFETQKNHPREKTVCSRACSNTYFRSGENNGNYKNGGCGDKVYRTICFSKKEKKCVVCGFDKIIEVHHLDGDNNNNKVSNLIPLCPNHHKMIHTNKYKKEIEELIEESLEGKFYMKEICIYLANESSQFDTGTIIQPIDSNWQTESYFRGVGLIKGVPKIVDIIFFDEVEFVYLPFKVSNQLQELADEAQELDMGY